MKKCYRGSIENPDAVIKQLEKEGGRNSYGWVGSGVGNYYYILENGEIECRARYPKGYELAELPVELPLPRGVYVSDYSVEDAFSSQRNRTLVTEVVIKGKKFYICEPHHGDCPIFWRHIAEIPKVQEKTFTESEIRIASNKVGVNIAESLLETLKNKK